MRRSVQVVLTKDVPSLGRVGDVVTVAPGYAHNFLLAGSKAVLATPQALAAAVERKRAAASAHASDAARSDDLFQRLNGIVITCALKANEKGTLYAALHARDVINALRAKGVHDHIEERSVTIDPAIHAVGTATVAVACGHDKTACLTVEVIPR